MSKRRSRIEERPTKCHDIHEHVTIALCRFVQKLANERPVCSTMRFSGGPRISFVSLVCILCLFLVSRESDWVKLDFSAILDREYAYYQTPGAG